MDCKNCGKEIPEGSSYCAACGQPVSAAPGSDTSGGQKAGGMAVASLVLGILAFLTCGLTSLIGLILGIISLVKIGNKKESQSGRGMAIAGTVLSGINILLLPFYIGIVAGIMYPVIHRASGTSREAQCLSHVRQLGFAMMMYLEEYDDAYPPASSWCDALDVYVMDRDVWACPDDKGTTSSYVFNDSLPRTVNEIQRPEETILIFEGKGGWNAHGGESSAVFRHSGGMSVVYADGHASFVESFE